MATKEVVVVGASLSYELPVSGPPAQFTGSPSSKVKAGGAFVFENGTQVTIPAGITNGTCTTNVPGIGNMQATASKVKGDGKLVLRKDDTLTVSGIAGVLSGGGACTLNATVKISNAGQAKVKAN